MKYKQTVPITLEIDAAELGTMFAQLTSHEQAAFWQAVHEATQGWAVDECVQWAAMGDEMRTLAMHGGAETLERMAAYATADEDCTPW